MKYLYIAGLEHSGTTLVNHLLVQQPGALGLGEVRSFFSPEHMRLYMEEWGGCKDVRLCSCGEDWDACRFWGEIRDLNGLLSDESLSEKYRKLFSYIKSKSNNSAIIVDSSKDIETLKMLVDKRQEYGFSASDLMVVMVIKDVRSFTTSIYAKTDTKRSLLNYLKTFNWWYSVNNKMLNYLRSSGIRFTLVLYEKFCNKPHEQLARLYNKVEFEFSGEISMEHAHSHIAMGNKNFLMRNRKEIKYDNRWFLEDGIQGMYLLHSGVRKFNKKLYALDV